jgi:succinate-semialdehyde dehydrogenase / glutarate-semialdehyde dehydrogenase
MTKMFPTRNGVPPVKLLRPITLESGLYINGRWLEPDGPNWLSVSDPATGDPVGRVVAATAEQARAAIDAAHDAFPGWGALAPDERARILRRAYDLVVLRADELARILTLEHGKPVAEAKGEVLWGAEFLLWYAEEIRRPWGEILASNGPSRRLYVRRRPRGVVVCITPWNFPSSMILRKIAPATAAGNTVVLKPAEQTPLSATALFQIFDEAGFPPGVVNLVCGDPLVVGDALTTAPQVRQISFTGSVEVGKLLLERGARTVTKVSLELGGHAPAIVFDDADLEVATTKIGFSKFQGGGQSCIAANRLLVQEEIAEEFASRFATRAESLRVGHGLDPGVAVGPLIDAAAVDRVRSQVVDAVQRGARVLTGGDTPAGMDPNRFFAPTILADVPPAATIAREETFGPVAPLIPFRTEDDAVRMANATLYGLAAYVFTRDLGRAHRVSEALDFGMVAVNDGALGWVQAPFGGIKESGDGREGGRLGLEEYLDVQYISLNF